MKKLAIIAVSVLWISGLSAAYSQTPRTGTEPGNLPAEKPETAAKIAEKTKTPGDAVIVWNANAGVAATKACIAPLDDPFHEARMYAMMHIAIHDALNAIDRRFRPYTFDKKAAATASPDAAVAAAAHDVLVPLIGQLPRELPFITQACIDAANASAEAAYTAALAAIPDSPAKTEGIAVGQAAAAAILAKRAADSSNGGPFLNTNCPQDTQPGKYRCTNKFVAFEKWADVTPFVLEDNTQFRPGPPYSVTDKMFADDYKEVKSLGGDGLNTPSSRTDDQTAIGLFWWESSPLKWSRIARTIAGKTDNNLWQNARLFALLDMTLADGYIAMSASKNYYNFWRPVTAIQNGEVGGNPDASGDPNWKTFRPTPANQDYPSGHSIEGGGGGEVLRRFFGTDQISFQDCGVMFPAGTSCGDPSPVLRSFTSISQAENENAYSRIYIGFHFRKAVEEGTKYGRKIGERAVTQYLLPQ
jgi:hypothetical protein